MEKDNEVSGVGKAIAYEARIYDSRLGKWLSTDPLEKKYPAYSTYSFCGDNPIFFKDVDGRDWFVNNRTGQVIYVKDATELTADVIKKFDIAGNPSDFERLGPNDMFGKELIGSDGLDILDADVFTAADSKIFMEVQGYVKAERVNIKEKEQTLKGRAFPPDTILPLTRILKKHRKLTLLM